MKRWGAAVLVCLIVASAGAIRLGAAQGAAGRGRPAPAAILLASLRPISTSRPGAVNNFSAVTIESQAGLATYNGKAIDRGLMFALVPGHGGASEADITFRLGKKYDRLSGVVLASGGGGSTSPVVEIQDVSKRAAPRDLFTGQADQSGQLSLAVIVRGVEVLKVSASASFDCVCDSATSALVAATLTTARAPGRP
jgi:hypothetical protein